MKKLLSVLVIMTLSTSAFAGGSWKLNCTTNTGVSFSSDNGLGFLSEHNGNSEISIENYDLDLSSKASISWSGSQKILSENYENSCNLDVASTIFEQNVVIKNADGSISEATAVCREDIETNSSAVLDECLSE